MLKASAISIKKDIR